MDPRLQILVAQVAALRAAVGTLQAQIDAFSAMVEGLSFTEAPPQCPHRHVENMGTMGEPKFECQDCGAVIAPAAES